jgi:hypothetical protein
MTEDPTDVERLSAAHVMPPVVADVSFRMAAEAFTCPSLERRRNHISIVVIVDKNLAGPLHCLEDA